MGHFDCQMLLTICARHVAGEMDRRGGICLKTSSRERVEQSDSFIKSRDSREWQCFEKLLRGDKLAESMAIETMQKVEIRSCVPARERMAGIISTLRNGIHGIIQNNQCVAGE